MKRITIQEHQQKIKMLWGIWTLLTLLCLIEIGYIVRTKTKISPQSSTNFKIVKEVRAIEKEKIVYKTPETIEEKICSVFKENCNDAIKVAKCESGLNPLSVNKTSSARGLFQIMQSWHKIDQRWLFIPEINIQVAYQLWRDQGWEPWRASNHCHGLLD